MGQAVRRASLCIAFLLLAAIGCSGSEHYSPDECKTEFEGISSTYSIDIVTDVSSLAFPTYHGMINGRQASTKAIADYSPLFNQEFASYPLSLVKRMGLKRVVMCKELSYGGQLRTGVPDFEHNALYLDVACAIYDRTFLRKIIHHETFHVIDYKAGQFGSDERWSRLNPPSFRYVNGGHRAHESLLTDDVPGFLNHYSTTAVEEDKAEVFANMMVEPAYIAKRIQTDSVLRAKVSRMREQLITFCPDMNERFWDKVAHSTRRMIRQ